MDKEHIHKYQRVLMGGTKIVKDSEGKRRLEKSGGTIVFKCMKPNCRHYLLKAMAEGMESLCWRCGEKLILNMENMAYKKPTHKQCRKTRDAA